MLYTISRDVGELALTPGNVADVTQAEDLLKGGSIIERCFRSSRTARDC